MTSNIPSDIQPTAIAVGSCYQHYKGNRYTILALARHTETLEELVIYQALYEEEQVWVRSLAMFVENVEVEGHTMPRFRLV